jgi:hypothetical protein
MKRLTGRLLGRTIALGAAMTTVAVLVLVGTSYSAKAPKNTQTATPSNAAATGCGENSFFDNAATPAGGSVNDATVGKAETVTVVYHDETPINTASGFAATLTVTPDTGKAATLSQSPATAPTGTHDKYNTLLTGMFTPTAYDTTYTVSIKAWDSDQNKQGGDCGVVSWTYKTSAAPVTTTLPPTTLPPTTTPPAPSTTTPPTTAPAVVQGEVISRPAPAVVAQPRFTG